MQSIIRDFIMEYFLDNNFFSNKQCGFIKGRSTVLQLLNIMDDWTSHLHCVSKKVPTYKLSVTLSNLNRFSKFFHCWKVYEIWYKIHQHYPPHLRHVAALPWEIKNSNFLQVFSRYGRKCKQLHFKCTNFNSSTCVTVYVEWIYAFLSKSCPCRWIPCWLLTSTAVMSAVTNFRCHKLIAKVNK